MSRRRSRRPRALWWGGSAIMGIGLILQGLNFDTHNAARTTGYFMTLAGWVIWGLDLAFRTRSRHGSNRS